jgi:tRNA A-37 threonylcarbamoyl transferase component Bud32
MSDFAPAVFGVRHDYACDPAPTGRGGYAEVFRATHKPTGSIVALKRLPKAFSPQAEEARERMRREVEVMKAMVGERHVMPVLDHAGDFSWYVMPLARGDLRKLRDDFAGPALVDVLRQAATGLLAAHARGYVHRDITPMNILRLSHSANWWVIADWGLVRKPPGMTTTLLTASGDVLGTDGFVAPEVFDDPHRVTSAADVYSLGRVVSWAVTGRIPLRGERSPPPGAFRQLVRQATQDDPSSRPTLSAFVDQLDELMFEPAVAPTSRDELLGRVHAGDAQAARELVDAADADPDDDGLYLDYLAKGGGSTARAAATDQETAERMVEKMAAHMADNFGYRNFDYLNTPLGWMLDVAQAADEAGDLGLLEDVAAVLFRAEVANVRWRQRDRTRSWLGSLGGESALAVARGLRSVEGAREWLCEGQWRPVHGASPAIRQVLSVGSSRADA